MVILVDTNVALDFLAVRQPQELFAVMEPKL